MHAQNQTRRYSYRDDPAVPGFSDEGPVVFMDGECMLCSAAARTIARLDRREEFRICPIQSPIGSAVMVHFGFDPKDPDSWLYLTDGTAYTSMDGIIMAGRRLGGVGRLLGIFTLLPPPLRQRLYLWIARNRYRLFGRGDLCAIPDEGLRRRLLQ